MRRFLAFIGIVVTSIITVFVCVRPSMVTTKSNMEYSQGKEYVYRITNKSEREGEEVTKDQGEAVRDEMQNRLESAGISEYEVALEGNDTVRVSLHTQYATQYTQVRDYLAFSSDISIANTDEEYRYEKDEMFNNVTARVDYIDSYPCVVIPVNNAEKLNTEMVAHSKEIDDQAKAESSSSTASDSGITENAYILVWNDWVEGDSLDAAQSDTAMQKKIIMAIDYTAMWWNHTGDYVTGDDEIYIAFSIGEQTSDGLYTLENIQIANTTAHHYANLFNASTYDVDITCLFEDTLSPTVESLLTYGLSISMSNSKTMIAIVASVAILLIALLLFYRLSGLAIFTNTLLTSFLTLIFFNLLGIEFNVAGLIGLIIVTLASTAMGVLYATRIKEELFKGRTLKKANSEAGKRTTWPTVDMGIITIIIGFFVYIFGGELVKSLGSTMVLGGAVSVLLALIVLKILMWLPANATSLQTKYDWFGVDPANVPNLMKEEKQTYRGYFAEKNLTKHHKPIMIVAAALVLASVVGMISFGVIKGNIYNTSSSEVTTSRLYIYIEDNTGAKSVIDSEEYVSTEILGNITIDGNALDVGSVDKYSRDTTVTEQGDALDVTYYYYVVTFNTIYTGEETAQRQIFGGTETGLLYDLLQEEIFASDDEATFAINVGTGTVVQPKTWPIMLGIIVGLAVACAYMFARYGISKFFSTLLVSAGAVELTLGFFVLTRISVTPMVSLAAIIVSVLAILYTIYTLSKANDEVTDLRVREKTLSIRLNALNKSNSLSATPILELTFISLLIMVVFLGFGPSEFTYVFVAAFLGIVFSVVLVLTVYTPITSFFMKQFGKIHFDVKLPKKKKNKGNKPKVTSAEPEEAVFIGIND